jgi:hypothetical protein
MREFKAALAFSIRFLAIAVALTPAYGSPASDQSALYCANFHGFRSMAAVRLTRGGALKFGLTKWRSDGQNFAVTGVALRKGPAWLYRDGSVGSACQILIKWDRQGRTLAFQIDAKDRCQSDAGQGFTQKSTRFIGPDFVAPERGELSDSETFFNSPSCDRIWGR